MCFLKMLFRKNQQTKNQVEQQIPKCEALPLYDFDVPIDCFDIYLKRNNDLQINIGDTINFRFEPSAISNSIDAVAYLNNIKIGYLQHKEAKWLRVLCGEKTFTCTISRFDKENFKLYVSIKLPYDNNDKNLPLKISLVGVSFNGRQKNIKFSIKGDLLTIKHEPTNNYQNTIKVYNNRLGLDIGVLPDETSTKYLKKYKENCIFSGVITSIYGGEANLGVDIVILKNINE